MHDRVLPIGAVAAYFAAVYVVPFALAYMRVFIAGVITAAVLWWTFSYRPNPDGTANCSTDDTNEPYDYDPREATTR